MSKSVSSVRSSVKDPIPQCPPISEEDIQRAFKYLSSDGKKITKEDVRGFVDRICPSMTLRDYKMLIGRDNEPMTLDELKGLLLMGSSRKLLDNFNPTLETFKLLKQTDKGTLDQHYLLEQLKEMNDKKFVYKRDLNHILSKFDLDKDGELSYEDYAAITDIEETCCYINVRLRVARTMKRGPDNENLASSSKSARVEQESDEEVDPLAGRGFRKGAVKDVQGYSSEEDDDEKDEKSFKKFHHDRNYEEELQQEEDEEEKMEGFNLKQELEEGHFDEYGNYIEDKDHERDKDNWLESISQSEIKKAKNAQEKRMQKTETENINTKELIEELYNFVDEDETVLESIRRNRKEKKIVEKITEICSKLMENGFTKVYDWDGQNIQQRVSQWEYKWNEEEEKVYGPFSLKQMIEWKKQGFFNDSVQVRKKGEKEFISIGYTALLGEKGQTQTIDSTVQKLCDRLEHASLLEDRRTSVLSLKGLSREYSLEVGSRSLRLLIQSLNSQDIQDVELGRALLETIHILCSSENKVQGGESLGIGFTEIFVKDSKNVVAVLDLLDNEELYIRYNAIQVLATALKNRPGPVQDSVLVAPMGVHKLVNLLDDEQEIIRNDGLLLLIELTASNADIQKIIAFENAFERVLHIIYEQGGVQGDIVVQDCLLLIIQLLKHNISNQNYFREASCVASLAGLFQEEIEYSSQQISNMIKLLELVRVLAVPESANVESNQQALNSSHVLEKVAHLSVRDGIPEHVQIQALYALGDMIRDNKTNQQVMTLISISVKIEQQSLLSVLLHRTLSLASLQLRAAHGYAVQMYVKNNPGPLMDTLNGSFLLECVIEWKSFKKDPYKVWFACLLTCLLPAFDFTVQVDRYGEKRSWPLAVLVLTQLMGAVRENAPVVVIVAYLKLLCQWSENKPPAVKLLFGDNAAISFLTEIIMASTGDINVQGLAALLLGSGYEFSTDESLRSTIHNLIVTRISIDVLFSRLKRLRDSLPQNDTFLMDDPLLFEYSFVSLFKHMVDTLSRSITKTRKEQAPKSRDREYEDKIAALEDKNSILTLKIQELEKEQEDLLVCLAEQDMEMKKLKKWLRELGQDVGEIDDDE